MTREDVLRYAAEQFGTEPDFPWEGDDVSAVLRHRDNRKWFALLVRIPGSRLQLPEKEDVDIMNVKTDLLMTGSLLLQDGILPAWHMNKNSWVTVLLDGTASDEQVCELLDMSYALTRKKHRKC